MSQPAPESRTVDTAELTNALFEPLVGSTFVMQSGERELSIDLQEVTALPRYAVHTREPFSLVFSAPADIEVLQGTYILHHEALGSFQLFLVPIGGSRLEAVFN